jgi:hypothetical protein
MPAHDSPVARHDAPELPEPRTTRANAYDAPCRPPQMHVISQIHE